MNDSSRPVEPPPSPFSREGSRPEDGLGVGPAPVFDVDPVASEPSAYPSLPASGRAGVHPTGYASSSPSGFPAAPRAQPNPYAVAPNAGGYRYGLADDPRQDPLAVVSLVIGIVGLLCWVTAPVALVTGLVSAGRTTATPERFRGRGMALAGIVLGVLGSLVGVGYVVLIAVTTTRSFP